MEGGSLLHLSLAWGHSGTNPFASRPQRLPSQYRGQQGCAPELLTDRLKGALAGRLPLSHDGHSVFLPQEFMGLEKDDTEVPALPEKDGTATLAGTENSLLQEEAGNRPAWVFSDMPMVELQDGIPPRIKDISRHMPDTMVARVTVKGNAICTDCKMICASNKGRACMA